MLGLRRGLLASARVSWSLSLAAAAITVSAVLTGASTPVANRAALPASAVHVAATPARAISPASASASAAGAGAGATVTRSMAQVLAASAAPPPAAPPWTPEPAVYAVFTRQNVPVKMVDGVVLQADLLYPADPGTGIPAPGPFPVLLTQTPYGKAVAGPDAYLVQRGFIEVVVDVRGTGASHGHWGLLDPDQTRDAVQLVSWAAAVPHSNGKVGLFGASYLGINQLLTAAAVGAHSPLKAIFPLVASTDVYRDAAVMGGIPDSEFFSLYLGYTALLNATNPARERAYTDADKDSLGDFSAVEADHLSGLSSYHASYLAGLQAGGDLRFDGPYWAARRPHNVLAAIVANQIPAYLVGGWYDLFQRGEPLNYAALQNAWAGRSVDAPMAPGQRVTGRYQLLMGPWYHDVTGQGTDLERLQLEWFDTWLRGEPTGMDATPTPLHLFELGANRYLDAAQWPLPHARPMRLHLVAGPTGSAPQSVTDGALSPAPPAAAGSDPVAFTGASNPCSSATEQWSGGYSTAMLGAAPWVAPPCLRDDRADQLAPGAITYTSAPFAQPAILGGPIGVSIYATSTTPDTEWVVNVEDVGPDGTSVPLTEGALLGSLRALDAQRSWWTSDGGLLMPYHPSSQSSSSMVAAGNVARYDVEVLPTFASIAKGHRVRVTISTSDTPHLLPTSEQLANLVGGVYQVLRSPGAASFVELPIAPEGQP